jgi:hypothetical protein
MALILLIAMAPILNGRWEYKVNALYGKGLVEDDIILYPSITTEFLEVATSHPKRDSNHMAA